MDQLPRVGELLRAGLAPRGRLLLLSRRAPAPAHALSLQQRPDRRGRPLLLHQRRRRGLEPQLRARPTPRSTLRVPPRPRLHAHHQRAQGRPRVAADVRPAGAHRRDSPAADQEHRRGAQEPEGLLVHRVVSLERLRRHDQLPAQLLDRRGRDRARRQHALSQDRVPRAARPLRVLQRQRPGRGLRHRPRDLPRPLQRLGRAAGRPQGRSRRTRSPAAGRRSPRTASTSSSRPAKRRPSSSRSATSRSRAPRSGRSPASSTRSRRTR